LTTLAVIAAGTGSAGGLTAVVVKKLHDRKVAKTRVEALPPEKPETKEPLR
jgi:hypothetical protein